MTTYKIEIETLRINRTVRDSQARDAIHFLAQMEGFEVTGHHLIQRTEFGPIWRFDVMIDGSKFIATVTRA